MTTSISPKVLKGGLILIDPESGAVQRVIALQYNPDLLTRTLVPQSVGGTATLAEPLRLKGPPIETIKLDAEIDATDQLEFPDQHRTVLEVGIHPQLAALETIVYPDSGALIRNNQMANAGTLEIVPVQAPLPLFVWSKSRVVPVRITDFSIIEEAFDVNLNPIRARVNLGMRVLNINDLGFGDKGGHLFMVYQQSREQLARKASSASLSSLGLSSLF
ncbi:hypothetical protein [Amantichitinum ursilacus]|uniref:Uncharacterized protein n=1 Tax=Amantichitinum ursilacus TaxID=857265 RepID=A0A0N1JSA7_9NEIS|nr:hypothetical protein [Amantichitinum ursilacus]KPC51528.1 hypothetical protein WG78_15465 [Amantichitinum ursilacus]